MLVKTPFLIEHYDMKAKTKKLLERILSHTEDKLSEAREKDVNIWGLEIYPYEKKTEISLGI